MRPGVPCRDPPSGRIFVELGPVAVAQPGNGLPGEALVQADQRGDDGASGDAVRGDKSAAPWRHLRQQLVDRGPGALGDLAQTLTVNATLNVFTRLERRLLLGVLLSPVTRGPALP